jgi:hypothetical protein
MSKTLIIITRDNGEYDTFWKFDNLDDPVPITRKEIEDCKVIFIKKETDFSFESYSKDISNEFNVNPSDEIGILIHAANGEDDAQKLRNSLPDEIKSKLKFCTWYSTTLDGFWDENDINKSLPYNALKNALETGNGKLAAFNKVWNFFLGDPVLEAKLELLQDVLNDKAPEDNVLVLLRKNLPDFDNRFKQFEDSEKLHNGDIFSMEYQTAFESFRDSLGIE